MNPSDTSIARDRTRRTNSVSVYARNSDDSGQQDRSPIEYPGQPDPASDLSGQQSSDSSPQDHVDNSGVGNPHFPPIPQDPQYEVESSNGAISSRIDRSAKHPELSRCFTSGSSGVTSSGSQLMGTLR